MANILLVEDDESLNKAISFKLSREGYEVFPANSVIEAINIFDREEISLIILDITLPDGNGLDFCRKIRKRSDVFIIFLTALDQEIDIVIGYDSGGDDYVTKPFSLAVLISKVNAILKRSRPQNLPSIIISDDITYYINEIKIMKGDKELVLSKNEIKLLKYFMDNPMQIITKEQLLNELWDVNGDYVDPNTLAVNISRLRNKLADNVAEKEYIRNIRGIGYIWTGRCEKR